MSINNWPDGISFAFPQTLHLAKRIERCGRGKAKDLPLLVDAIRKRALVGADKVPCLGADYLVDYGHFAILQRTLQRQVHVRNEFVDAEALHERQQVH